MITRHHNAYTFFLTAGIVQSIPAALLPQWPFSQFLPEAMKRPAAKQTGSKINATIQKLKKGVSKEDLVKNRKLKDEEQTEDGQETHRDKSKGQKYAKLKETLPAHIVDLVEVESKKASSPREFKTLIINKLFKKTSSGKLELNLNDNLFEEHKRLYTKKFSKETDHAMPAAIMRGLYFQNDEGAFMRALKAGDIEEVEGDNGKTYFSFTEFKKGKEHGSMDAQVLKGNSKINQNQAKLLQGAFASVGWSWNYKEKDAQKFLPGANIPPAIMNLIREASDSQSKLAKEATSIIKQWTGDKSDERFVRLKKGHCICNQNIAKLNHMKEFHELPDDLEATKENLDQVMMSMATHTSDYNELIETSRGFLKSKKK